MVPGTEGGNRVAIAKLRKPADQLHQRTEVPLGIVGQHRLKKLNDGREGVSRTGQRVLLSGGEMVFRVERTFSSRRKLRCEQAQIRMEVRRSGWALRRARVVAISLRLVGRGTGCGFKPIEEVPN
jgi:hypothetical protein